MAVKHALLIAHDAYVDQRLRGLAAPQEDVLSFKQVLQDKAICGFDYVKPLINSDFFVIQNEVTMLFKDRNPDDFVLLYFSGHGLLDEERRLYLALSQTSADDPWVGSLEADSVRRLMDRCRSRKQVIILDCCHSGAFSQADGRKGPPPSLDAGVFGAKGYGRYVFAASSSEQSAFERGGRSVYTRALIEGLRNGEVAPRKEVVTVVDLQDYLSRQVPSVEPRMRPLLWADEQTEALEFARNPRPQIPLSPELVEGLKSERTTERLGTIDLIRQNWPNFAASQRAEALKLLQAAAGDPEQRQFVARRAVEALGALNSKPEPALPEASATPAPKPTESRQPHTETPGPGGAAADRRSDFVGPPVPRADQGAKRSTFKSFVGIAAGAVLDLLMSSVLSRGEARYDRDAAVVFVFAALFNGIIGYFCAQPQWRLSDLIFSQRIQIIIAVNLLLTPVVFRLLNSSMPNVDISGTTLVKFFLDLISIGIALIVLKIYDFVTISRTEKIS